MLSKLRIPAAKALKKVELSLVLTDNKNIKKINRTWRTQNKATDVLSFPQHTLVELKQLSRSVANIPTWFLGDVIISLDKARAQAKEYGFSLDYELRRLLVHGILHLLGYDHEVGAKEARRMQRLEKRLLTKIGY